MTDPKKMAPQERDARKRQIDGEIAALKLEQAQLGRSACEEFERDFKIGSCCRYKEYNDGNPFIYAMIVNDHYEDDGARVPTYLAFKVGPEEGEVTIEKYNCYNQFRGLADFASITAEEFEKGKKAALDAVAVLASTKPEAP